MSLSASWQFWALIAAVFAALTAIFAKIGISDIDSDLATFIRTCVIMLVLGAILTVMGKWRNPQTIPLKTWVFLGLLAGRELAIAYVAHLRDKGESVRDVLSDAGRAFLGLIISILLAFLMPFIGTGKLPSF